MNDELAVRTAARLLGAYRSGRGVATSGADGPDTVEAAYRIQDAVIAALPSGQRVSAWKVSPPNPAYGITASPIPPPALLCAPVALHAGTRGLLGVEVEIAFLFGGGLTDRTRSYSDEEVFAAVDAALVAIELCTTRLDDWQEASALWRLADFQSNGALVVGTGVAAWRELDFSELVAQLWVDGALRAQATGSHPTRDPSQLLPWLARHAADRCGGLAAGDIVTTGTWTGLAPVTPGERIEARFPGVGAAALELLA